MALSHFQDFVLAISIESCPLNTLPTGFDSVEFCGLAAVFDTQRTPLIADALSVKLRDGGTVRPPTLQRFRLVE